MGNAESVVVSRHERKHGPGRKRAGRTVPVDRDEPYRKRPQHTPSSGSDASSRRRPPRQRPRDPESQTSSDNDIERPSRIRYSRDYSHGEHSSKIYVVAHGNVGPVVYPNSSVGIPPIQRRGSIEPHANYHTYEPARSKQPRQGDANVGSYIPRPPQATILDARPIDDEGVHRPSPQQWSQPYPSRYHVR